MDIKIYLAGGHVVDIQGAPEDTIRELLQSTATPKVVVFELDDQTVYVVASQVAAVVAQ